MDELQLLSELLPPAPPPSPQVAAVARARMTSPPPRLRRRGWMLATGAVAAAAAATMAAITLTGGGTPPPTVPLAVFRPPIGAAMAGSGGPGRPVLLTAARAVAQGGPVTTGRFWEVPAVAGNFIPVGQGEDHYLILEVATNDQFMASKPSGTSPEVVQQLSVQLASRADRAAWRRAGSPTTWHVYQEYGLATPQGPSEQEERNVTAGRDRLPFVQASTGGHQAFVVGDHSWSARQLLALPADPARLRRLLLAGGIAKGWPGGTSAYLFQTVPAVLDMPVTPAVSSALYRMLAAVPGVRSAGQVRDVAGQAGQAVTLTERVAPCGHYWFGRFVKTGERWEKLVLGSGKHLRVREPTGHTVGGWMFSSCVVQQRLIISPASGLPMAQELRYMRLPAGRTWSAPGGLFSYEIFGTPHWTSAVPRVRLRPPGR